MNQIKCTIPLKNVKMNADICNNICQFTINQTYFNDESDPVEVDYVFPLSAGTSVYDFKATINDDTIIETQIKPKDIATQEYNKAIREGNQAILMERPDGDVFALCLGNVPPKATVQIQIRSVTELHTEIDTTQLRLNVPLTIMPKYTPKFEPSDLSGILDSIMGISTKPYDFILEGQIYMSDGIVSLDSKTHKIKLSKMQSHQLNFEICPENLDQDIVLSITRNKPTSFIICESTPTLDPVYNCASQINIIPDYSAIPEIMITDLTYIIVLDRSGSMSGTDFVNCIKSAKIFIAYLPFGSKFNIYEFGDNFTKFNPQMVTCSAETKQSAIKWIDSVVCGGGTEVLRVMEDIYKGLGRDAGNIIFLSDGGVSNTDQVVKLVSQNKSVKVYTIGIGKSVSQDLIQRMADNSGAVAEFINSGDDQLREKVLAQLRRVQESTRKCQQNNELKIDVDGVYKIISQPMLLYENDVNTFYIFSANPIRSITYNQYNSEGNLLNTITLYASHVSMTGSMIHKMAGIKLMDSILNEESNTSGSQISRIQQQSSSKDEIIKISQNIGILSKWTAFVGVAVINTISDGIVRTPLLKKIPLQHPNKYAFDVNKMLPKDYDGDWFDSEPVISTRGSHLLHPKVHLGINTVGSSLQNCTYDIPNPKIHVSPWMSSTIEVCSKSSSSNRFCDTRCDNVCDARSFNSAFDNIPKPVRPMKPKITPSYIVTTKLSNYMVFDTILTSTVNIILPFSSDVKVGDCIELTTEGIYNGLYKVISFGSTNSPWVLEKV